MKEFAEVVSIIFLISAISFLVAMLVTRHVYCAERDLSGDACEESYKALTKDGFKP